MPYRLATPQYSVNEVYYSTVYSKKQAILMRLAKIEKVFVCQKVADGKNSSEKILTIGATVLECKSTKFIVSRFRILTFGIGSFKVDF